MVNMKHNDKCMRRAASFLTVIKLAIFAEIQIPQFVSNGAQSESASKLGLPSFHAAREKNHLAAFLSHEPPGLSIQKAINLVSRSNKQILRTSTKDFLEL